MNIIEEAERARKELSKALADLSTTQRDLDTLTKRFEILSGKLQTPGTKFLVELEYRLLYDSVLVVPATSGLSSGVFETLPGLLHAVYLISAYCDNASPSVICDGEEISGLTGVIGVSILRKKISGPAITAEVWAHNNTASERNAYVRVWRRLGMGS